MILFALAAAMLGPPGILDMSDARTIYTETVAPDEGLTPDCREWNRARQNGGKESTPLEAWVEGVITGYNLYHAKKSEDHLNLLEGRSLPEAFKIIDHECADSPEAALADVTTDLIADWRKR
jgi:hypothetical protein